MRTHFKIVHSEHSKFGFFPKATCKETGQDAKIELIQEKNDPTIVSERT